MLFDVSDVVEKIVNPSNTVTLPTRLAGALLFGAGFTLVVAAVLANEYRELLAVNDQLRKSQQHTLEAGRTLAGAVNVLRQDRQALKQTNEALLSSAKDLSERQCALIHGLKGRFETSQNELIDERQRRIAAEQKASEAREDLLGERQVAAQQFDALLRLFTVHLMTSHAAVPSDGLTSRADAVTAFVDRIREGSALVAPLAANPDHLSVGSSDSVAESSVDEWSSEDERNRVPIVPTTDDNESEQKGMPIVDVYDNASTPRAQM